METFLLSFAVKAAVEVTVLNDQLHSNRNGGNVWETSVFSSSCLCVRCISLKYLFQLNGVNQVLLPKMLFPSCYCSRDCQPFIITLLLEYILYSFLKNPRKTHF